MSLRQCWLCDTCGRHELRGLGLAPLPADWVEVDSGLVSLPNHKCPGCANPAPPSEPIGRRVRGLVGEEAPAYFGPEEAHSYIDPEILT